MSGTGTCRTCGAAVIWITTPSGRPMPLEAKGETMYLPGPPAKAVTAHRSHFSSCPQAKDWRKPPEPASKPVQRMVPEEDPKPNSPEDVGYTRRRDGR